MRKPLTHTKVTVKLRKSEYREEWYLVIESYPVHNPDSNKPGRIIEAVKRTITTPIWDTTAITGIDEEGNYKYKPKRDANGIIQCESQLDKEACIYANKGIAPSFSNSALKAIFTLFRSNIEAQRESSAKRSEINTTNAMSKKSAAKKEGCQESDIN